MANTFILLLILLAFLAGIIWLQVFLSKKESKWPGLVMPIISFLFGLLYPLNMVAPSEGVTVGFIIEMIIVWALGNIPTFVLLAIYFGCRGKNRKHKELDKMNIQDLD